MAAAPSDLELLARLHGVQTSYHDAMGGHQVASPESLLAVLQALDAPLEGPEDVAEALRARQEELDRQLVEPVVVAWDGVVPELQIRPGGTDGPLALHLDLEEGGRRAWTFDSAALPAGSAGVRRLTLPERLPLGYHRLRVEAGGRSAEALVLAAPSRAFGGDGTPGRLWGVFLPLYALRTQRGWGAGDLTDLEALAGWTAGLGGGVVGTLPLLAAFLDEPCEPSPYGPASRQFWNELYLDPRALPEFAETPAQRLVASDEFRRETEALRAAPQVDYARLMFLKRRVFEEMAHRFFSREGPRREQLERYLERKPELATWAAFRAVMDRRGEAWPSWPERLRDGKLAKADFDEEDRRYHLWVQWAMDDQMGALAATARRRGPGLYLDLPLGVHGASYDVWREQALFVQTVSTGAPPDTFFTKGQDWGSPPLSPERLRAQGYRYLIACLRHHLEHAGMLRIDHVMQLHRLFWIPRGMGAAGGVYVRYPAEELYAVLSLESHRHQAVIVGENLGTVPPEVGEAMDRRGVLGMYVLQYELQPGNEGNPRQPPPDTVASLNTHDMATFRSFWEGRDVDDLRDLGLFDEGQAREERERRERLRAGTVALLGKRAPAEGGDAYGAVLRDRLEWLAASPARMVLVNLEDLWGELEPQNTPGTYLERVNWRRKARLALEEIQARPDIAEVLRRIDTLRRRSQAAGAEVHLSKGGVTMDGETAAKPGKARKKPAASEQLPATASATSEQVPGEQVPAACAEPSSGTIEPLTEHDLHLFNEGTHTRLYRKLGAQHGTLEQVAGTRFAVWAPAAARVSVIGDWNGWEPGAQPLEPVGRSGLWQAFVSGVAPGALYKLHVESRHRGYRMDKADPFAFRAELPPRQASVVWDLAYEWGDGEWMAGRGKRNALGAPVAVYEVHLGSWRRVRGESAGSAAAGGADPESGRPLTYREIASPLAAYVKEMGFTHVELMPVMEHPYYGSWGYQITGYYAPTSRYGTPQDLMFLIDHLHQEGIGVILDWVPSHFATDAWALAFFDGTHLYEHPDPRKGYHPDWGSYIFNYERPEVRSFLASNALYWLDLYHADGLRVDAVASMLYLDYSRQHGEWIPNVHGGRENLEAIALLRQVNEEVEKEFPDVQTVAEESTAWPLVSRPTYLGGLGFGMKWDMGWMHDTLEYLQKDPVHRHFHHGKLTFRSVYAWSESYVLPLSHDEVVHGKGSLLNKMPGDDWQKFANLRLLFAYFHAQPGKKLLFMGGEIAQRREWSHERSLDWHLLEEGSDPRHKGVQSWLADLNRLYQNEPALHERDCDPEGFEWIDCTDAPNSVLALLRKGKDKTANPLVIVLSFTPVVRENYRIGVPGGGRWNELLNSDAEVYGGSGKGNYGGVDAVPLPMHGRSHSVALTLPPLGALFLQREAKPEAEKGGVGEKGALAVPEGGASPAGSTEAAADETSEDEAVE